MLVPLMNTLGTVRLPVITWRALYRQKGTWESLWWKKQHPSVLKSQPNPLSWTPFHYRQFIWSQRSKTSYNQYHCSNLYNTAAMKLMIMVNFLDHWFIGLCVYIKIWSSQDIQLIGCQRKICFNDLIPDWWKTVTSCMKIAFFWFHLQNFLKSERKA